MKPEEVKAVIQQALGDWHNFPWLPWLLTLILLAFVSYFVALLIGLGTNWATMCKLRKMTQIVEDIRANSAHLLEDKKLKNQLQLAALDKRLAVHQEAYALWRELYSKANRPNDGPEMAFKCQEWWKNHCLYLSADVRQAFYTAYWTAFSHSEVMSEVPKDEKTIARIEASWKKIEDAGDIILNSVSLPSMTEKDKADLPTKHLA